MADRPGAGRRRSRRDSLEAGPAAGPARTPPGSKDRRTSRRAAGKPVKERWLLTRKTWRYMADAGRRLIPDSAASRPAAAAAAGASAASALTEADIPKLEQYFQEVCARESKFLLWRKASYPGSLGAFRAARRRRPRPGGSCRAKTSSADEAEPDSRPDSAASSPVVSGKLDLAKVKREWLLSSAGGGATAAAAPATGAAGSSGPAASSPGPQPPQPQQQQQQQLQQQQQRQQEAEAKALADMLQKYLIMQSSEQSTTTTVAEGSAKSTAASTRSVSTDHSTGAGLAKEPAFARATTAAAAAAASASSTGSSSSLDYQKLIEKLEQHLSQIMAEGRREEAARGPFAHVPGKSRGSLAGIATSTTTSSSASSSSTITGTIAKVGMPYQSDLVHKSLLETLSRYYNKSPNREHVISDILTDRKLLEKLYFDLRCTRGFRGPRATGAYASPSARWWTQPSSSGPSSRSQRFDKDAQEQQAAAEKRELGSPPPLIAVQGPSTERGPVDSGTQTEPVARELLEALLLEREREEQQLQQQQLQQSGPGGGPKEQQPQQHKPGRRRSSVDNDDVSPSVSDTIKRYLRMARKKSMDADKSDRFKRVNYDRNLRNIRPKGELSKPGDDEGNSKGCQTAEDWLLGYRELSGLEPGEALSGPTQLQQLQQQQQQHSDDAETTSPVSRNASSRSSIDAGLGSEEQPPTPKHHQSFLSHLLHGSHGSHKDKPHSAPGSPALTASSASNLPGGGAAMQKSKSSSSVVHHGSRLVAKKIWKSRSKSSSRAINLVSTWTPQGKCTWAGTNGRRVTLQDTPLRSLSEVERKVLCRVAVAKLQALNLGVHIRPPTESLGSGSVSTKPKRRAYLLKRKALTTGFFDSKSKEEKEKGSFFKKSSGGLVFGISLAQCLENDRLARIAAGEIVDVGCLSRSSRHGSRTSFTSLIETTTASKTDEGGSCESLSSKGGSGSGGGPLTSSDSGVLAELSDAATGDWDAVPTVVKQCVKHLQATGLHTLGIFRVSPSKKRVRQLREDWDCGRETKIGPDQCPHDVAALLKEYFRDLPDPLLCRDLYQAFVHTQKIRNRRLQQEALQHLIQLLPTPNRETLYALLNFLSEVAANSEDRKGEDGEWLTGNKMDTTNLATVFAPNILHCVKPGQARSELSAERAEERIDVINVVRALLEHVTELFVVPAALLDELYLHMMDSHPAELDAALSRRVEEVTTADDTELCSETENCSVDENPSPGTTAATSPTSTIAPTSGTMTTTTTTSATMGSSSATTATRKLYSREECLHQSAGVGGDIGPRPRRVKRPGSRRREESSAATTTTTSSTTRSNSLDSGSSEEPADPRYKAATTSGSPMVITASLTIPMSGAFTLNLDDPDIPYIEDSSGQQLKHQQQQQQHQPQPNAPPRRQRQRSASGSEGGGGRHGSDSAVGSSATLSGDQAPSSPASWASSPPASPDSAVTAVSYIPDQPQLQRVSFTTSSELSASARQIARSGSQQDARLLPASPVPHSPVHTPSITSIGGAVMRSKTADIERMLHISRSEHTSSPAVTKYQSAATSYGTSSSTLLDSKKYTKRRYTDSRHQTRHIPDAESLASANVPSASSLASRLTSALHQRVSGSSTSTSAPSSTAQPVWKRRELISSAPKERGSFF